MSRLFFSSLIWVVFSCFSLAAQQENIQSMFSPKLKQFLIIHPGALQLLTNTISEAFNNRSASLYYFYSNDKSVANASHYYPDDSSVCIIIRENQQPIDEFVCFLYESINSEGEKIFQHIYLQAEVGDISRDDFVNDILKQEFKAAKRLHDLIVNIKVNSDEISSSDEYKHFLGCPDKFGDFVAYTKRLAPEGHDVMQDYYRQYDSLKDSMSGSPDTKTNKVQQ
jgi:hypothetical protein